MVRFFDSLQANTNKEKNVKLKLFFLSFLYTFGKHIGYKVTALKEKLYLGKVLPPLRFRTELKHCLYFKKTGQMYFDYPAT